MKKIEHFVLPENTNKLYKEEAISSIGLTRDIADKMNELVDAYNEVLGGNLEAHQELEGYIRKGVVFMKDNLVNSIHDLFEVLKESGELQNIIDNIYTSQVAENTKLLAGLNVVITPEMYGAVGDGITDDTEAFLKMIADVEMGLPEKTFENEETCKDYSHIDFKFGGIYKIRKTITFEKTYGLKLENLKLVAGDDFIGDSMLYLKSITRNFKGMGMILDGCFNVDTCLNVWDYTITFDISNTEIKGFNEYGFLANGKGHEIKATNLDIHQYEWGMKNHLDANKPGTGICLGSERYDNNFTNVVVKYCNKAGVEINGSATTFMNSHFYSCKVNNFARYNTFDGCYFDNAVLKCVGFFTAVNNMFLQSGDNHAPFIYLDGTDETSWVYDTCILNNNTFKSETQVSKAIDLGEMTQNPRMNTIGNTFYYVTPFTYVTRLGHAPNPWDKPREEYGDETSGYKIYGNLAIVWGTATESGFQSYPNGLELAETIHIGFERQDNSNPNLIPWANTIRANQFWLNSVGTGSTVKWVVIGIVK